MRRSCRPGVRSWAACPRVRPRTIRSRCRLRTPFIARSITTSASSKPSKASGVRAAIAGKPSVSSSPTSPPACPSGGRRPTSKHSAFRSAARRFRASLARSTCSTRACSRRSRCSISRRSPTPGPRATTWRPPATPIAAPATWSCSWPPTCISKASPPRHAPRPLGRSWPRRRRSTIKRRTCARPGSSPASTSCARKCA